MNHRYWRASAVQLRQQADPGPETRRLHRDITHDHLVIHRLRWQRLLGLRHTLGHALIVDHQVTGGRVHTRLRVASCRTSPSTVRFTTRSRS